MGKSRMINEVAKKVFTIPICLSNGGGLSKQTGLAATTDTA